MNYLCIYCGKGFEPNPRVKNQRYCNSKACQKARRAKWRRYKMATDPDYLENQKRCQNEWQKRNVGYWKNYRNKRPEYVQRNNALQQIRNAKRRKDKQSKMIAKIDSLQVKLVPIQAGRDRI